jgi:hypothetical protein
MSRAQERSTAIRAERVPTFSNPWGLLATTPTSGTGPKALVLYFFGYAVSPRNSLGVSVRRALPIFECVVPHE